MNFGFHKSMEFLYWSDDSIRISLMIIYQYQYLFSRSIFLEVPSWLNSGNLFFSRNCVCVCVCVCANGWRQPEPDIMAYFFQKVRIQATVKKNIRWDLGELNFDAYWLNILWGTYPSFRAQHIPPPKCHSTDLRQFVVQQPDSCGKIYSNLEYTNKTNSVVLVRKRTVPTERPPFVGEVSAIFSEQRVSRGQQNESQRQLISVF
jgi:hypothetical protein